MKFWVLMALLCSGMSIFTKDIKVVLFPFQETQIAARLDSVVMPYRFRVGEAFKKGETICFLDPSRYELEVQKIRNHYEFSKAVFEDKKKLHSNKFTSDYEFKKAEFDMNLAAISLAEAKLNLSFCTIAAPFDGKITEVITKEYELCRSGQVLVRILNDRFLLATANVPMHEKNLSQIGHSIAIKLLDGTSVSGTVYEVSPQADHRSETVRIKILIDNRNRNITSGTTGILHYGK